MSFGFSQPLIFAAALTVIVAGSLIRRRMRKPFSKSVPLGAPGGVPFRPPFRLDLLLKLLTGMEYAALVLLSAAAAGPVLREGEEVWLSRGADIIFVLDISPSMAGMDMAHGNAETKGSRLDAARELVKDFAAARPSDALGLIAVGEDAALLAPPTVDRKAFFSALDNLHIGSLGDGTALGTGLSLASLHLKGSAAPRRAVVLITDGENNAGNIHPETAAAILGRLGVNLWVIAVGSSGEVPFDYVDGATKMRRTGTFYSRFDAESLRRLSEAGRGTYIPAPSRAALNQAFSTLDEGELVVRRSYSRVRENPCHEPFLWAALILICAARFIRQGILGAWL